MAKSSFIVGMAVIGLIASSACTRSGGSKAPIQQDPQAVATPIPNSRSELDNESGKSAQDDVGPGAPQGPQVSDAHDPSNMTAPQTPADGPQVVNYDPTGLTPSQIFESSQRQGPALIGNESDVANGQSAEPLFYTGSGQDGLRAQLQSFVDAKTHPERVARDKEFAKRVMNGRFDVDWTSRSVVLDVTIKGARGLKVYRFTGSLNNRLLFRGGNLRKGNHISVEAACMDLNGGCQTVYAKVQDGSGGIVRTAHMLIRQTEATLFTHADGFGLARNAEFDALLTTMVRTDRHAGGLNALNKLMLRTSETIDGQSNFKVEMGVRSAYDTQESLNFAGPLVKPAADISLAATAQVLRSSSPAADTIRSVTLINNDGRGTLTLAVTVRKATAQASEDTMELTVSRIHRPVRTLIVK